MFKREELIRFLLMTVGRFRTEEVDPERESGVAVRDSAIEQLRELEGDPDKFLDCQVNVLKAHGISLEGCPDHDPYKFHDDRCSKSCPEEFPAEAESAWWSWLETNNLYLDLVDRRALIARLAILAFRTPARTDDYGDSIFWFFEFLQRAGFDEATTIRAINDTLTQRPSVQI